MAALITLSVAKEHLRIKHDDANADILTKLEQATALIVRKLDTAADPAWTPATLPFDVQASVLLVLGHLWGNRGDADLAVDEALWKAIDRLLVNRITPALA